MTRKSAWVTSPLIVSIAAAAIVFTALAGWQLMSRPSGQLDESAKSAPWYPLLGEVYRRPAGQGVYWCMVRREQPFAPCPDCVLVCHQSLHDTAPTPPAGVFSLEDFTPGPEQDSPLSPTPVAIAVTPKATYVNGREIVDETEIQAAIVLAMGHHLRQAEILDTEPELRASLVVSAGTRSQVINERVMQAVSAGIQRVDLGVETRAVSLDLSCRPSKEIDVHLFETTFLGRPKPFEVLAGAEDALRWFCEDKTGEGKTADSENTHTSLAVHRWVPVHDNLARQRQMRGRAPEAASPKDDAMPAQGQVLLKIGAPGFALHVDQVRLPPIKSCASRDPAFQNATICLRGTHPEEVVKMSESARKAFADGELARGRAEIEEILAAYDFEHLETLLKELARRSGEDSLLLVGVEGDLPAAVLAKVLDLLHGDGDLFDHVVTSTSRF